MKVRNAPTRTTSESEIATRNDKDGDLKKSTFIPPTCGRMPKFDYTPDELFNINYSTVPGALFVWSCIIHSVFPGTHFQEQLQNPVDVAVFAVNVKARPYRME